GERQQGHTVAEDQPVAGGADGEDDRSHDRQDRQQAAPGSLTVRSAQRWQIANGAKPGRRSTKAEAAAKTALTSSPTGIATLKPAWSCSKRTTAVPKACSPMKPPVAMNARERSRTRASPRRFADSPAAYPRTNARAPT